MMKYTTTTHLTLSLILLISISISISISGVTGKSSSPVVDTDGNEVMEDVEYTLVAKTLSLGINSGGISLDSKCPPNVVQDVTDSVGLPIVFYSQEDEDEVIRTSTYLLINVADPIECEHILSSSWVLEHNEVEVRDDVDPSRFKLEKVSASEYKLAHCPSPTVCEDLLLPVTDLISSKRRLITSKFGGVPFTVTITKAKSENNLKIRKRPARSHPTT